MGKKTEEGSHQVCVWGAGNILGNLLEGRRKGEERQAIRWSAAILPKIDVVK